MTTSSSTLDAKTSLNILIVGAGVCGPAFALMLMRSNPCHSITIVERAAALRTGGQQIDLKSQGIPITKKLGLLDSVRAYCVEETGMEIVDKNGKRLMSFGVLPAGEKRQGLTLTNEYEFMRGDMVHMFVSETEKQRKKAEAKGVTDGSLTYIFNQTITALSPSTPTQPPGVNVTFSDSRTAHYDLVVAADGQGSRTRKLAFGEVTSTAAFKSLNIHTALYNIPRHPNDSSLARIYIGPKRRMYLTRTGNRSETQIYHFLTNTTAQEASHLTTTHKRPLAEQKAVWTRLFQDAGWETPRFLESLQDVDDFYACEIGQVKMPRHILHKDCVVLLGDAGYCPSLLTGMGTTLSLIGAYVLAGELVRNGRDVEKALDAYQEIMMQPVEECQVLAPGVTGGLYPTSAWAIWAWNHVLWTMSCLRVDKLLIWVIGLWPGSKTEWKLPEYEELTLDG